MTRYEQVVQAVLEEMAERREKIEEDINLRSIQITIQLERALNGRALREVIVSVQSSKRQPGH